MSDIEVILHDIVEELYFRAAQCRHMREEYMALKGVQHAIENVMTKHGMPVFTRPEKR